jgi:glycosyltransferase involved in cell wall biosynthesis
MIRVGFLLSLSKEWMGGVNYYKNLFYALKEYVSDEIEIVIFVPTNIDNELLEKIKPYVAEVIYTDMLNVKSIKRLIWKSLNKYFRSNFLIESFLRSYKIDVLSHSSVLHLKTIKTISWIPDFQHLHLPQMFSAKEIKNRNNSYRNIIKFTDRTIVSSFDAQNDFNNFAPDYQQKARVLQFVSQPEPQMNIIPFKELQDRYQIKKDFFYLPNQFWKHKNHMIVLKAAKLLKERNVDFQIVCTGHLNDSRNLGYINELLEFKQKNLLNDSVLFLGLIPYAHVFSLMKYSKAVINPSLFEGWSSTVEECKSLNKNMILSDINIHKEQYPSATFFDRNSAMSLADCIENYQSGNILEVDLKKNTKRFAETYLNIVSEVVK